MHPGYQQIFSVVFLLTISVNNVSCVQKPKNSSSSYILPSIFDKFPPYINFKPLSNCEKIPRVISKFLYWTKEYTGSRIVIEGTMKCNGINILLQQDLKKVTSKVGEGHLLGTYMGCWTPYKHNNICHVKSYTKVRKLPRVDLLHIKPRIVKLYKNLEKRLGRKLPWFIQSFSLPEEMANFRKAWEKNPNKYWVSKPAKGGASRGVKVISNWRTYNSRYGIVQKYIHNPFLYEGQKSELRTWYLITGYNPLRIYHIKHFDRFKFQFTNYSSEKASFRNPCIHIRNFKNPKCPKDTKMEFDRSITKKVWDSIENHGGGNVRDFYEQIHSVVITSLLEWENQILARNYKHRFGDYIILSFDFFIDSNLKLWLNEINRAPVILQHNTNFYDNFSKAFNIIGINFPPILSTEAQEKLKMDLVGVKTFSNTETAPLVYYNYHSCKENKGKNNKSSLDELSSCKIRKLAIIEDELSRVDEDFATRIFPSDNIQKYMPIIHPKHRQIYQLLQQWEEKYKNQRFAGRKFLNDKLNADTSLHP